MTSFDMGTLNADDLVLFVLIVLFGIHCSFSFFLTKKNEKEDDEDNEDEEEQQKQEYIYKAPEIIY